VFHSASVTAQQVDARETFVALPLRSEELSMFAPDNHEYYRQRAATERQRAENAASPTLARLHEQLAEAYEALVAEIEGKAPLRLVKAATDAGQIGDTGSERDAVATG
jgi:hypothetical protein